MRKGRERESCGEGGRGRVVEREGEGELRKGRETEGREEWEGHVDRVTVGGGRQRYE